MNARIPHHGSLLTVQRVVSCVATTSVQLDFLGEYSARGPSFPRNMIVTAPSFTVAGIRRVAWLD